MPIYHLHIKNFSRTSHKNFIACMAYRCGGRLTNEETGKTSEYTRKAKNVVLSRLIYPSDQHPRLTRAELWSKAQKRDTRKNSRLAKEIEINLPCELTAPQRARLVTEFAEWLSKQYGVVADLNIHKPKNTDTPTPNHHAHIMLTTRIYSYGGEFTDKSLFELSNSKLSELGVYSTQEQVLYVREVWENLVNKHLKQAGIKETVSCLSYEAQGKPYMLKQPKMPYKDLALARKGIITPVYEMMAEAIHYCQEHNAICRDMERLYAEYIRVSNQAEAERREMARDKLLFLQAREQSEEYKNVNRESHSEPDENESYRPTW